MNWIDLLRLLSQMTFEGLKHEPFCATLDLQSRKMRLMINYQANTRYSLFLLNLLSLMLLILFKSNCIIYFIWLAIMVLRSAQYLY